MSAPLAPSSRDPGLDLSRSGEIQFPLSLPPPLRTCLDASQISGSDLHQCSVAFISNTLTALQLIHLLMLDDQQCYHPSQEVKVTLISNKMMGF